MLSKPIPRWIFLGGLALAAVTGCVNAVGFLGVTHQALSHLSGTVTNLGIDLAHRDFGFARNALLVIVFFFLGAVVAGLIIRQSTLRLGRRYGVALAVESVLLAGAAIMLRHEIPSGEFLAAMACGLQNAMATSYSGAVIRTSHMTGIVTDLGIAVGLAARGERADWRRMRLYLVLLAGFLGGGAAGAMAFARLGPDTLFIPALLTGATGIGYTWIQHHRRKSPTPVTRNQPSHGTVR
jgi:uncharacterized membrane protein YoaK (UPF0700 family)